MSQSPAKPPPRRKTAAYLDDSSSDEEDIVALAKQQQAARPAVTTNGDSDSSHDLAVKARKPMRRGKTNLFKDDTDDDDDNYCLQAAIRRREEMKRKEKSSGDESNGDDGGGLKVSANGRTPRNPLTLRKEEEAVVQVPLCRGSEEDDRKLWSDHEEDAPPTPPSSKKKKKKRDALDSVDDSVDDHLAEMLAQKNTKKKRTDQNKKRDYQVQQVRAPVIPDISDDKINDLESELKPAFDNPKFGPFDTKPLKLGFLDDDDKEYQVPMSIRRYLPPYQQAGIQFLFKNAIMAKQGAILGDGTWYSCWNVR
jgi:hypothetical protein